MTGRFRGLAKDSCSYPAPAPARHPIGHAADRVSAEQRVLWYRRWYADRVGPRTGAPSRLARFRRSRSLLDRAELSVSNSRLLQEMLSSRAGLRSELVEPFVDVQVLASRPALPEWKRSLTLVGLDPWMGARLALELAAALPERSFLFLDGANLSVRLREEADRLPNVVRVGWVDDMAPVLDRTRILLMPYTSEEPLGRLAGDAAASNFPTPPSARGGLTESSGPDCLLVDPADDLGRWLRRVRELDDPKRYDSLARADRENANGVDLQGAVQ